VRNIFALRRVLSATTDCSVYLIEALEPRTLLSADFTLAATLALARSAGLAKHSAALKFYRNAHTPKIEFDEDFLEEISEEGEEGQKEPPQIEFDPSIPPGPDAPTLAGTIEGLNFNDDITTSEFGHIPPDPSGAAGPNHVVNVVNTDIEWYTKAGTRQNRQRLGKNSTTATGSFFASLSPANGTFDPKVVYDQYNGRFVVVSLEQVGGAIKTSRLLIAVSDDSDPNGTWFYTAVNAKTNISGVDCWTDYPGLAVDANAIYVTGNEFAFSGTPFSNGKSSYGGSRLWIISKSGLYSGAAPTSVNIYDPSTLTGGGGFTMQPAMMYGSAPGATGTVLVNSGWSAGATAYLSVIRVNNPLSSPTFTQTFIQLGDVHNTNVTFPADVPQLGTNKTIKSGDARMQSVVWRNNALWAANTINPPSGPDAGTATVHWYKISATSTQVGGVTDTSNGNFGSVADQGNVGGEDITSGTSTFYPAITTDSSNNVGIGFSASGPSIFPGAYYTGRLANDPAGTVQPVSTLAAGVDYYYRIFASSGGVDNRWGDYSGIAIDPSDGNTFWVYNEYALPRGTVQGSEDGRWGTRFGKFSFVNPVSATPAAPDLIVSSDTGTDSTDNITKLDNSSGASTLQFSVGNTVAGATVVVYADGTQIGSAVASGATTIVTTNGTVDLTDGNHSITAKQTENSKTVSLTSAALSIKVDSVAPTVTADFQFETAPQQLIYKFSEDVSVSLAASDLTVASVPAGTNPAFAAPSWNAANLTATFDFSSTPVPDHNYQATLSSLGVTDVAGNGVSGATLLSFFALKGDANQNKHVEITDFNVLASNFGKSGRTWSQGNFDYSADGVVSIVDFNVLAANFGHSLP
jgi:hypothetical protein